MGEAARAEMRAAAMKMSRESGVSNCSLASLRSRIIAST